MRAMTAAVAVFALALGGCGGDDAKVRGDTAAEATERATETLVVRVIAKKAGLGCTGPMQLSGVDVGNGSRLTVRDGDGTTVGTGTFDLSRGAGSCDWTAQVADVPTGAHFYELDAGGVLATLSHSELDAAGWNVDLHITASGNIRVSD